MEPTSMFITSGARALTVAWVCSMSPWNGSIAAGGGGIFAPPLAILAPPPAAPPPGRVAPRGGLLLFVVEGAGPVGVRTPAQWLAAGRVAEVHLVGTGQI